MNFLLWALLYQVAIPQLIIKSQQGLGQVIKTVHAETLWTKLTSIVIVKKPKICYLPYPIFTEAIEDF